MWLGHNAGSGSGRPKTFLMSYSTVDVARRILNVYGFKLNSSGSSVDSLLSPRRRGDRHHPPGTVPGRLVIERAGVQGNDSVAFLDLSGMFRRNHD